MHHVARPLLMGVAWSATALTIAAQESGQVFNLGEIVVIGARPDALSSVGGSVVTREQSWRFDRASLDQALNLAPGVVTTFDSNGRRNEADVFVRGFNRLQVPLLLDGVRIYLPADNRLDFGRFLTADVEAVQIQKGYASVIDGPGAMGGIINLVTGTPSQPFEAEGGITFGGRDSAEGSNGYVLVGSRHETFYVRGGVSFSNRDSWSLSRDYVPTANSLEDGGERGGSDTEDWRLNFKIGFTPGGSDEYSINFTKQQGEKGAPLNVYNNPPVPGNGYWRWPYWDIANLSFLSNTELGDDAYVKTKVYYTTFENGLDAYDNITYTTQSANGRFHSPYDDHAYGTSLEFGTTRFAANTLKVALHYRTDKHSEFNINQPTSPSVFVEPEQDQAQTTWSVAAENTFHVSDEIDVVAGISYDDYAITKAEEFGTTPPACLGPGGTATGLIECPLGGADAFNWQTAFIWRYSASAQFHASIADRGRFPTIFELYSQGLGNTTRTPNPYLGPEHSRNLEIGWEKSTSAGARIGGALFYNDVRDLVQSVLLPNATVQQQNVGDGEFYGFEVSGEIAPLDTLRIGGNYTLTRRTIENALAPNLRPTGVPPHKAFFFAEWRPTANLGVTPSIEYTDDRWSDLNTAPVPAFPFVETGEVTLVGFDLTYAVRSNLRLAFGGKNLNDENYELVWGFPQVGRNYYAKMRMTF